MHGVYTRAMRDNCSVSASGNGGISGVPYGGVIPSFRRLTIVVPAQPARKCACDITCVVSDDPCGGVTPAAVLLSLIVAPGALSLACPCPFRGVVF